MMRSLQTGVRVLKTLTIIASCITYHMPGPIWPWIFVDYDLAGLGQLNARCTVQRGLCAPTRIEEMENPPFGFNMARWLARA